MSNIKDFFGAATGAGFLGVTPPAPSATLNGGYNITYTNAAVGLEYGFGLSPNIPVYDSEYHAVNVDVRPTDDGVNGQNLAVARGARPTGGADWVNFYGTVGQLEGGCTGCYYYHKDSNSLYVLTNKDLNYRLGRLEKIDMVTGTSSVVITFSPDLNGINDFSHAHMYPVTEATPDTSDWIIVYQDDSSPYKVKYITLDNAAGTYTETNLKVDSAGTNQDLGFRLLYMSADKQVLLGSWVGYRKSSDAGVIGSIHFEIMRGANQHRVIIPYDGTLPLPYTSIMSTNSATVPVDVTNSSIDIGIVPTSDSIIFVASAQTDATQRERPIVGRRVFDRVDFDRWLHDICDALGMQAGEAYF